MALTTLETIQNKIRRLTRSPSQNQLSVAELNEYINTFILYDMPEHLRLFDLKKNFTFFTQPNIDTYDTVTAPVGNPLYDFKNRYITTHQPLYIAGYQCLFSQSQTQFYGIYPLTENRIRIGTGDGATTNFVGIANMGTSLSPVPILPGTINFSSVANQNVGLSMNDVPPISTSPLPALTAQLIDSYTSIENDTSNGVNYLTGEYDVTFSAPPADQAPIFINMFSYVASRPQAMLYFDDKFVFRPVPDAAYRVEMEVYVRPTELLQSQATTQSPDIKQWWQYIAYGAAKKVFEDRSDLDSVQLILPEYHKQELLVLRKTIVQQTKERVATIYSEGLSAGTGWGGGQGWGGGAGSF